MKNTLLLLMLMIPLVVHGQIDTNQETVYLLEGFSDLIEAVDDYWKVQESSPNTTIHQDDVKELNVESCIELALSGNPSVFVGQEETNAAESRIGQARSMLFPQTKATAGFTHIDGLDTSVGNIPLLGGGFSGDKTTRKETLTISQILYAGGQIRASVGASKYLAKSEKWREKTIMSNLEFQVKAAYYDCLLARAMVSVAKDSVTTFAHHLSDAEKNLEAGVKSNFEVLRAKTELGSRKSALVAARNVEHLSDMNLLRIIALPLDTPITLLPKMDWQSIDEPIDSLMNKAHEKRPEICALLDAIDAAEENIVAVKGKYKPRAAATAQWSNTDNGGSLTADGWTFNLGLEWDITTGGKRKYEILEAKAKLDKLTYQLADLKAIVGLEVRQAYIQVLDAIAKIQGEKGVVELAREGRRLAALRYKEGVGIQTEILDAELALTNGETLLVQALRNYAVARAALDKATGTGAYTKENRD